MLFQTFFFLADRESFLSSNTHSTVDSLPPAWQVQLNQAVAANKSVIKFRRELVKCYNEEADVGALSGSTWKEIAERVVFKDKDLQKSYFSYKEQGRGFLAVQITTCSY